MKLHKEEFHAQETSQTKEQYPKEQGRGWSAIAAASITF